MDDTIVEVFHRNGTKVIIGDIPTKKGNHMPFNVMWVLQKLIDEIDHKSQPNNYYSLKDYIT